MARKQVHPKFLGTVENGRLVFDDKERFDRYKMRLNGRVEVVVKPYRRRRTIPQNAYLWAVVYGLIADYTGMTQEEVHEAMKMMFRKKIVEVKGRRIETVDSTADASTAEFSEYIERIKAFAGTELGIVIPEPHAVAVEDTGHV